MWENIWLRISFRTPCEIAAISRLYKKLATIPARYRQAIITKAPKSREKYGVSASPAGSDSIGAI